MHEVLDLDKFKTVFTHESSYAFSAS